MMTFDADFQRRIIAVFGDNGRAWLDGLPTLIEEYAERWDLQIGRPFEPLSYNYVAAATRADGTPVVFKAGCPDPEANEIGALRHWAGRGAVSLLEADDDARVFLMERIIPGTTLLEEVADDAEATTVAAGVMRNIARRAPQDHGMPTVALWARAFDRLRARHAGTTGPLPKTKVDRGESLYADLVASTKDEVVLHGDLHHWNILRATRDGRGEWLAIDPHGLVGDPAFEVGAFLRNPFGELSEDHSQRFLMSQPDVRKTLDRRLSILAEHLDVDRRRIRDWGISFATLSASWSDESGNSDAWQQSLTVADILASL